MTPKMRAEKAAAAMWEKDQASPFMGMVRTQADEGRAVLTLEVQSHHCNGHGTCHGGVIFMLADSAFGFACNSRNQSAVAQHNTITYLAPGRLGDTLTATADEVHLAGRSGTYDVPVTNQEGTVIALFRGLSRIVPGQHFEEDRT